MLWVTWMIYSLRGQAGWGRGPRGRRRRKLIFTEHLREARPWAEAYRVLFYFILTANLMKPRYNISPVTDKETGSERLTKHLAQAIQLISNGLIPESKQPHCCQRCGAAGLGAGKGLRNCLALDQEGMMCQEVLG